MTAAPPAAVPPLPAPYLRAVLAHPEDDGPRLVAADWWDEQGAAARAEFVRVQCELARLGPMSRKSWGRRKYGKRIRALNRRELKLYRGEWDAEVIPAAWVTADEIYPAFVYRRGFVEGVICPATDFLAHADAIRAACPLKRVQLTGWIDVIEPCAPCIGGEQAMRIKGRPGTTPFYDGPLPSPEEHRRGARFPAREPVLIAGDLFAAEFPGIDFELSPVTSWDTPPPPTSAENMWRAWELVRGADPRTIAAPREGTGG
jgi:uncharacterized protein (TIGR02996 family)